MNHPAAIQTSWPAPGSLIPAVSTMPYLQTTPTSATFPTHFPSPSPVTSMPQRKKRPGPKRDSKPATSEKLERNRQAQRSHRERKEQYLKQLETEVQRLKEMYFEACRERDTAVTSRNQALMERHRLMEENQTLRGHMSATSGNFSPTDVYSLSDATAANGMSVSLASTPTHMMAYDNSHMAYPRFRISTV